MRSFAIRLCRALAVGLAFTWMAVAHGAPAPAPRAVAALDDGWEFIKGDAPDAFAPAPGSWTPVRLPHTFNADDATTAHPYRGPGWYRRTIAAPPAGHGRTYLEFDGAALATDVWLNGAHVGRHEGGFARFRFDVTDRLQPGANALLVRVDNARHPDVAPLGGDYTLYGGLYRRVRLVTTADVHVDMLDAGGPGVYFSTPAVTAARAGLHWRVRVANERAGAARVVVAARLRDAAGKVVATARRAVVLPAGDVVPVEMDAVLAAPHLWQGVDDPYLYTSDVTVAPAAGGAPLDRVEIEAGVRTVRLDADKGLLLNGRPYRVHGVNVHLTYAPGKGVAVSDADVDADYRILDELGVTGLRFAHYQHDEHSYALADRKGFLVWTELPLTSEVGASDAFLANAAQQARELVRQNFNHPSVFVWGLGNEIYKVDAVSARVLDAMQRLVHDEDASRPTVYANCCAPIDGPQAMHTDAIASNVYFGWYDKEFADLAPFLASNHALRPHTPEALSEYGAGGSNRQQEDPPRRPVAASHWHPEQYQALYHEAAWRQIEATPWLWASFVWTGFDFASSGRNEGDGRGVNDKGLVSMDRTVRKDAYYWYQANWSHKPMVHVTSRRAVRRTHADAEVKVYSNQPRVRLAVNGVDLGERTVDDHIARWPVHLAPGANRIEARAGALADSVEWTLVPDAH
ncbi:glycoside hydrolase family 2 protein [Massilia rhizosphaerae]|uniref:glycoside hydrolase family 2 protein n=1 Tax=Massilia rhizosphaerae TaxID=2784389 RepID=UPI0018DC45D1|nr:glycoside hydrolase family 2 TIM barrel-domain containing protein [Massilia rhizosphaerae]